VSSLYLETFYQSLVDIKIKNTIQNLNKMEFLLTIKLLLYTSFLVIFLYKISKWLFDYLYKLSVVNKLKGLQIIPFIGNAHQLERKHSITIF
jgi:hypothetical protein